jgi:undecaprenyl-diphosphatase
VTSRHHHRSERSRLVPLVVAAIAGLIILASPTPVRAETAGATAVDTSLAAWKAVVLGLVEGITEYLPVSSTGHLLITERLLDVGTTPATEAAADTYAITIQSGAILAVLVLYRRRIGDVIAGALGRSATGRQVLAALAIGFVPSAAVGFVYDDAIKDHLLSPGPVAAAWVVGALAIWVVVPRVHRGDGAPLELIRWRQAAIIGVVQMLALWPGTSRSLVTIIAALAVGLSMSAAVEFSFLLGLLTLGAATVYDGGKNGSELVDTFGLATPLLGLVVAFVSAVVAVRWMVTWLQTRDLRVFAVYRIAVALAAFTLIVTNTI